MRKWIENIWYYLQGNIRYEMYYTNNKKYQHLIPLYIREQYEWRIKIMDRDCYLDGQCKMCVCETTKLQFANKACDKPCYLNMMSELDWKIFKMMELKDNYGKLLGKKKNRLR